MASSESSKVSAFYVMVTGQVEGCQIVGGDNLYCKYSMVHGNDWSFVHGLESGMSQISHKGTGLLGDNNNSFSWNYPIDVTFRSTNVFGWPQVIISVYGITLWGNDIIRGYGCTHLPTSPGRHVRYVQLYAPRSSSLCQQLTAWLTGNQPEFFDSKFIAQGKGREVTRVASNGTVKLVLNVVTKNMSECGYVTRESSVSRRLPPIYDRPTTSTATIAAAEKELNTTTINNTLNNTFTSTINYKRPSGISTSGAAAGGGPAGVTSLQALSGATPATTTTNLPASSSDWKLGGYATASNSSHHGAAVGNSFTSPPPPATTAADALYASEDELKTRFVTPSPATLGGSYGLGSAAQPSSLSGTGSTLAPRRRVLQPLGLSTTNTSYRDDIASPPY